MLLLEKNFQIFKSVFFWACSLQNQVGDLPFFFYISDMTNSTSFNGKIFRKKSMLENFRANVLKPVLANFALEVYCFNR